MILERILEHKREELGELKRRQPLDAMMGELDRRRKSDRISGRFRDCLEDGPGISLIAEVKKASPSKGIIRDPFDPVELARLYERGGAKAVSVLTDERFFQGSLRHLNLVSEAISLPVLRKEFIIDPYQLVEAKFHGADAVLLIVAALDESQFIELHAIARELGLDVLVEIHTEDELGSAMKADAEIIGINNRDLRTFETTLSVTADLVPCMPPGVTIVSESGIHARSDVATLEALGVDAVLVGEAVAKSLDVAGTVRDLLGEGSPA